MKKLSNISIDLMNYIIDFSNQTITEESRNKAKIYFDNFDDYREIFDNMIYIIKNQSSTPEKIEELFNILEQEYRLLGFNEYINFDYLNNILFLVLRLNAIVSYNIQDIWLKINAEINELKNCSNQKLKNEIFYLCIKIINNYNIIVYDLENTNKLLEYCRDIDFDDFKIELLPISMLY